MNQEGNVVGELELVKEGRKWVQWVGNRQGMGYGKNLRHGKISGLKYCIYLGS